jgi:hypothetical protein
VQGMKRRFLSLITRGIASIVLRSQGVYLQGMQRLVHELQRIVFRSEGVYYEENPFKFCHLRN